jgi:hypothetical protein
MTSLPVPSLSVTWLPFMSHPLAMLLPVMDNCTCRTTAMVRKKRGNALPGMCRTYFQLWRQRTMPSFDIFSWVIYRVPPNPNIKVVYRESTRNISGERAIAYALLEVTSPEATLTVNDVTLSHVTGSDVITGSMFCTCPEVHSRVRVASGDVTSSNAYAMARSPEIFLVLSRYTTLIFGFGGTL